MANPCQFETESALGIRAPTPDATNLSERVVNSKQVLFYF